MAQRHSVPVRGLLAASQSPRFEGKFGRMFRSLHPAKFGKDEAENLANLAALGDAMSADFDKPFDGKDPEESGIPALYTYLGQFVDHDLTFDPASSLQKQNDPDALTDFRTPAFDLDNVYGRGPDDQPYMYDGEKFLLGAKIQGGDPNATDLPRNTAGRALIGDPRNDENAIVSQLQGLLLRFHNRFRTENSGLSFSEVQQEVRFHYQYVVLNDFLSRIVHSNVLSKLKDENGAWKKDKLKFYHWRNAPFMPVEFSVAAYRLGHSMIRPGYRLNDNDNTLLPIFPVPSQGLNVGLTGFQTLNAQFAIDWGRFIDVDVRKYDDASDAIKSKRLQFAYRLDTSLVNPLHELPPEVVGDQPKSLAGRNLQRGWRLGLPSGQDVARAMGEKPLDDKNILIGKATGDQADLKGDILSVASGAFKGNCPLWTYILAEAMANQESVKIPVSEDISIQTPRLGPVGGRIVAEVFLGLMFGDPHSMLSLNPDWCPRSGLDYKLKNLVNYALGH
jgi:hypothetical protein